MLVRIMKRTKIESTVVTTLETKTATTVITITEPTNTPSRAKNSAEKAREKKKQRNQLYRLNKKQKVAEVKWAQQQIAANSTILPIILPVSMNAITNFENVVVLPDIDNIPNQLTTNVVPVEQQLADTTPAVHKVPHQATPEQVMAENVGNTTVQPNKNIAQPIRQLAELIVETPPIPGQQETPNASLATAQNCIDATVSDTPQHRNLDVHQEMDIDVDGQNFEQAAQVATLPPNNLAQQNENGKCEKNKKRNRKSDKNKSHKTDKSHKFKKVKSAPKSGTDKLKRKRKSYTSAKYVADSEDDTDRAADNHQTNLAPEMSNAANDSEQKKIAATSKWVQANSDKKPNEPEQEFGQAFVEARKIKATLAKISAEPLIVDPRPNIISVHQQPNSAASISSKSTLAEPASSLPSQEVVDMLVVHASDSDNDSNDAACLRKPTRSKLITGKRQIKSVITRPVQQKANSTNDQSDTEQPPLELSAGEIPNEFGNTDEVVTKLPINQRLQALVSHKNVQLVLHRVPLQDPRVRVAKSPPPNTKKRISHHDQQHQQKRPSSLAKLDEQHKEMKRQQHHSKAKISEKTSRKPWQLTPIDIFNPQPTSGDDIQGLTQDEKRHILARRAAQAQRHAQAKRD